jgi:hypothetical protein
MADRAALAMLADWRDRLDCALKAVERVARSRCNQFKSFVVIITANFAFCHLHLTCEKRRAPDQLTKLCASRNCMLLWLAPTSPVRHRLQPTTPSWAGRVRDRSVFEHLRSQAHPLDSSKASRRIAFVRTWRRFCRSPSERRHQFAAGDITMIGNASTIGRKLGSNFRRSRLLFFLPRWHSSSCQSDQLSTKAKRRSVNEESGCGSRIGTCSPRIWQSARNPQRELAVPDEI